MGFDLVKERGKKGYFRFDYEGWWDVLRLAVGFGWQPKGTGPPRGVPAEEWDGSYFSNDGQLFYARDAKHLADTLEKILSASGSTPLDFEPLRVSQWLGKPVGRDALRIARAFQKLVRVVNPPKNGKRNRKAKRDQPWLLSEEGRSCLRRFAKFCRGGSFRIY